MRKMKKKVTATKKNAENEEKNDSNEEKKNEKNEKDEQSQDEDLKFNNSFNDKAIGLDEFKKNNKSNSEEEQKEECKDKNISRNNNQQNNNNSNNEESRANVTYKPDNDKTDINFDDNTNNNRTRSKGNNPNSTISHKLSKKKSGIVISDNIDEDEEDDADGVIFKNRGRIIYDKNNVSEETFPNFIHQD